MTPLEDIFWNQFNYWLGFAIGIFLGWKWWGNKK